MCEELEEELEEGNRIAKELCEHLERMSAANGSIPVTLDSGCYIVQVRKTI